MGWLQAFETFPILETERFILRNLQLSDAANMFDYFSREEVVEFYDVEILTTQQEAVEMIESLLFRYQTGRQIRWGITLKGEQGIIGTCGFHTLEQPNLKAEIGYELHPDFWGRGIMTEVIERIVNYGFNEMDLNRIEALYNPLNHASWKVLKKNGFKHEGIMRKRFLMKGKFTDAAIAATLREDHLL